uniref:G-protein coupled receptors family 1 profile domain-containing protein n=1 Tax=Plectus sambesii TaxID=2011161 RepID=A0A914VV03_9BILA
MTSKSTEALAANSTPSDFPEYVDMVDLIDPQTNQMAATISVLYLLLAVVGILLNVLVLMRLLTLWRRQSDRFFESSAMPLTMMTCCDLLSLIIITVLVRFTFTSSEDSYKSEVATAKCKASVFLLHASAGVSRWCWLFASSLRYAAVYHPLWHRRQWRLGHRAVPTILVASVVVNSWLLFSVKSTDHHCTVAPILNNIQANRSMHVSEMTWNYLAPVCITAVLDMRVLFLRPPRLSVLQKSLSDQSFNYSCGVRKMNYSTSSEQILTTASTNRRTNGEFCCGGRTARPAYQWLVITSVNLLFNAPHFVLRLLNVFDIDASNTFLFTSAAVRTVRLLYFLQFCINASYLSTVVFRRPVSSRSEKKTAQKWSTYPILIAAVYANDVANSNFNSAPLLYLESLEPWPAVNGCHSVAETYTPPTENLS